MDEKCKRPMCRCRKAPPYTECLKHAQESAAKGVRDTVRALKTLRRLEDERKIRNKELKVLDGVELTMKLGW